MTEAPQKGENPCKSRDFEVKHMTYAPALNCIKYSVGIDPTCGSGSLLLQMKKQFDEHIIEESFFGARNQYDQFQFGTYEYVFA